MVLTFAGVYYTACVDTCAVTVALEEPMSAAQVLGLKIATMSENHKRLVRHVEWCKDNRGDKALEKAQAEAKKVEDELQALKEEAGLPKVAKAGRKKKKKAGKRRRTPAKAKGGGVNTPTSSTKAKGRGPKRLDAKASPGTARKLNMGGGGGGGSAENPCPICGRAFAARDVASRTAHVERCLRRAEGAAGARAVRGAGRKLKGIRGKGLHLPGSTQARR